jgi:hypothetical protein
MAWNPFGENPNTNRGSYSIGQQSYAIDPNFASLLYSPLEMKDLGQGFQFNPQAPMQTMTPSVDETPEKGYVERTAPPDGGKSSESDRQVSRDTNYSSSDWFNGWNPNVSIGDALKNYGPALYGFHTNPLMTTINSMRLDPIKDKLLQRELTSYLGTVAPDVSLEDFIGMYNTAVNANFNSKVNAKDTIRGLAMGLDDTYADAYAQAVNERGLRPDQFAKYQDEVDSYNAAAPVGQEMSMSAVDPRAQRLGLTNVLNPVASLLATTGYVADGAMGRQAARNADIAATNQRLNDIVGAYGYSSYDSFRDQVLGNGGTSSVKDALNSGMTGPAGAAAGAFGGVSGTGRGPNDVGGGSGGGGGMTNAGYGPGDSSNGSRDNNDGDSSNDGRGQHE